MKLKNLSCANSIVKLKNTLVILKFKTKNTNFKRQTKSCKIYLPNYNFQAKTVKHKILK